jgi:hypothetical protein
MAIVQHSKMIQKRSTVSGEVPVLGPSTDHADGTWTALGIYTGEFFYNIPDNRLWIGGEDDVIELFVPQVFEMTYAEAQALKDIDGSPAGDGLIIGAIYKITDKGDDGLILTAIALDKFSNYCDEIIASPVSHIPALYDFDNDILTYPCECGGIIMGVLNQSGSNDPTAILGKNDFGTPTWNRINTGIYTLTINGAFPDPTKLYFSYTPGNPTGDEDSMLYMDWYWIDVNTIGFYSKVLLITGSPSSSGVPDDDRLVNTNFKIERFI